jgi:hypothetical protein
MSGPIGGAAQLEMPPPLQHAVEDGLGEIGVVEDAAPGAQRLVGLSYEEYGSPPTTVVPSGTTTHLGGG